MTVPVPERQPDATKRFHMSDVLSITTGRMVSAKGIGGIYEILNWMTDDSLFTHQLPRAMTECEPWLKRWFPELPFDGAALGPDDGSEWREKLAALITKHGEYRDVPRVPRDDHAHIDPVSELFQMVDDPTKITVIDMSKDGSDAD